MRSTCDLGDPLAEPDGPPYSVPARRDAIILGEWVLVTRSGNSSEQNKTRIVISARFRASLAGMSCKQAVRCRPCRARRSGQEV